MIGALVFWIVLVPLMICVVALAAITIMLVAGFVLMRVARRLKRRARRAGGRPSGRLFDRAGTVLLVVGYPSARLYARLSDDVVDWENWITFGELGVEMRRRD